MMGGSIKGGGRDKEGDGLKHRMLSLDLISVYNFSGLDCGV